MSKFRPYYLRMSRVGAILVVCTGNVCRSPYIERLLAAEVAELGVEVSSAGTMALADQPMEEGSARLLADAGVDAGGFAARQLMRAMVQQADLVLTATREHRSQVVRTAPRGLRYTFALDDFSDLVADAELSDAAPSESPDDTAVTRMVARALVRRADVAPRHADDSGIVDPFRQGPQVFDQMAQQVAAVLPSIVAALRQMRT